MNHNQKPPEFVSAEQAINYTANTSRSNVRSIERKENVKSRTSKKNKSTNKYARKD